MRASSLLHSLSVDSWPHSAWNAAVGLDGTCLTVVMSAMMHRRRYGSTGAGSGGGSGSGGTAKGGRPTSAGRSVSGSEEEEEGACGYAAAADGESGSR